MKKIILIICIFFLQIVCFSQSIEQIVIFYQSKIDSTKVPIEKIEYNLILAELFIEGSPNRALNFMKEVNKLLNKTTPMPQVMARIYKDYALIYNKLGDFKQSVLYFEKEIKELTKFASQQQLDSEKYNLATITYNSGDFKTANKYYSDLLTSNENIGNPEFLKKLYKSLYLTNKSLGNYQQALFYFEKYLGLIDKNFWQTTQTLSILTEKLTQKEKAIIYTEQKYQETKVKLNTTQIKLLKTDSTLQKTKEEILRLQRDSLQNVLTVEQLKQDSLQLALNLTQSERIKEKQEQKLQSRNQTIMLMGIIIGIVILSAFILILLALKLRKNNILLKKQKEEISYQSKLIDDSINYASFIQKAILPKDINLSQVFEKSFVFWQPKSQVSGDFLWFSQIDDKKILTAVDCTGHGVPGAFISIVANNILNEVVNIERITKPSEILNNLHTKFVKTMQRTQDQIEEIDDGMDLVLCTIDQINKKIEFAGAQNSLIVFQNNEFKNHSTTHFSIGQMPMRPTMPIKFENKEIEYSASMLLILMTDGYTDQFGAKENAEQKYGYQRLFDTISENFESNNVTILSNKLKEEMELWKKDTSQIDDMLILGVYLE